MSADFFDPRAIGYVPPDPEEPLRRAAPDLAVYWLGREFPGAGGLPGLVLARVDAPVSSTGPGYRFIIGYARADDPFGPPVLSLQLFLAHVAFGQTVVAVTAPGVSGASGMVASPYQTRHAVETIVRALQPRP